MGTPAKTVRMTTPREPTADSTDTGSDGVGEDGAASSGRKGTAISVGGGGVRAPSKHLAGHKEVPYGYVRMLYRWMDQGVTATS